MSNCRLSKRVGTYGCNQDGFHPRTLVFSSVCSTAAKYAAQSIRVLF